MEEIMTKRFLILLGCLLLIMAQAHAEIPEYQGYAYEEISEFNLPDAYYSYSKDARAEVHFDPLDELGRAGGNYAIVTPQVLSGQRRDNIASIIPTGFEQASYPFIENSYLYDRCHLIGSQFATTTEIPENVITGTFYLNWNGMHVLEDRVATYVQTTGNSIFYTVIPDFREQEVVCRGVLMIAATLEDPDEFSLAAYCFNVQPGVMIDYSNGYSDLAATAGTVTMQRSMQIQDEKEQTYIMNIKTHVFHYPGCSGVANMKEKNKKEYTGTREELIDLGYKPCGTCNP